VVKKHSHNSLQWKIIDLHLHTPASSDYQQPDVSYLDILQRAESRGLDIIAITDHNTVAGYRIMQEEIEQLELLEKLNRLFPDEKNRLNEYHRLRDKILVLPGFEFTATFGFHILGIFAPDKPIRDLEHLLFNLNIPSAQIDEGSSVVGATTDVLTAYRMINQAGGIVIAAHANSNNGVSMRGYNFGGQTKIAYTQDFNLHALEVTDLELKSGKSTAAFFDGTKPEYPRRMHCIQGSDSHRLYTDPNRKKNLGIGDRSTDIMLPEVSFDALKEFYVSNDFFRSRPHRHKEEPVVDYIQEALEEGPNIIQDFHESVTIRGGKLYAILADISAFMNTNGGTLYIGVSSERKKSPAGVPDPEQTISQLEKEINKRISPPLQCNMDLHDYMNKKIIRVLVPRGSDPPYALDDNKIYIRNEAETGLAVRDEIVSLVNRSAQYKQQVSANNQEGISTDNTSESVTPVKSAEMDLAPHTGVEVLQPEEREGTKYYSMRDLRNGNIVKNVTKVSARRLWHYAINQYIEFINNNGQDNIIWHDDFGLISRYKQGKSIHYDFIQKIPGGYRFYFGVTEDGIHGPWKSVVGELET
jgi:hypothetical protein